MKLDTIEAHVLEDLCEVLWGTDQESKPDIFRVFDELKLGFTLEDEPEDLLEELRSGAVHPRTLWEAVKATHGPGAHNAFISGNFLLVHYFSI